MARGVLQIRLTEADENLLDRLTTEYGLDRTALVRFMLRYVNQNKPVFQIAPEGKVLALTQKKARAATI